MSEAKQGQLAPAETDLVWAALCAISFDEDKAAFSFTQRLARDNGWQLSYAKRVTEEYRKFAYLCVAGGHEMTPSDEVDQAWHLHLTYTEHYWGPFRSALGAPLHHNPTSGGPAERERYSNNYDATLAAYKRIFAEDPPADIWPPAAVRFGDAPYMRRINRRTNFVIPKATALPVITGGAGASILYASVAAQDTIAPVVSGFEELASTSPALLVLAGGLGVLALFFLLSKFLRRGAGAGNKSAAGSGAAGGSTGGKSADSDGDSGGGDGGSGCGGGCGGCGG